MVLKSSRAARDGYRYILSAPLLLAGLYISGELDEYLNAGSPSEDVEEDGKDGVGPLEYGGGKVE